MDENEPQSIPLKKLVLGTAGLGGVWKKVDPEQSVYAIQCALQEGINRIDTAPPTVMLKSL